VQSAEALLPNDPIALEPAVKLCERLGSKSIDPPLSLLFDVDESRLSKHPQVPRDAWTGDRQCFR